MCVSTCFAGQFLLQVSSFCRRNAVCGRNAGGAVAREPNVIKSLCVSVVQFVFGRKACKLTVFFYCTFDFFPIFINFCDVFRFYMNLQSVIKSLNEVRVLLVI